MNTLFEKISKYQSIASFCFLFGVLFLVPTSTQAASVMATSSRSEIHPGELITINILLDAEEQSINAISGKLFYDSGKLRLYSISTSSSIINAWLESPEEKSSFIEWSGIIPGGFSGVISPFYKNSRAGNVFSVSFVALENAEAKIFFNDLNVYDNDGKGIALTPKQNDLILDVTPGIPSQEYLPTNLSNNNNILSPEFIKWGIIFLILLCVSLYLKRNGKNN